MSARKLGSASGFNHHVTVEARQARLALPPESVVIHKNGIEFLSLTPFPMWTEMTITLQSVDSGKVHCSGVVIACNGNKHSGYHVSMVFTGMSKQAQTRLSLMATTPAN